MGFTPAFTRGNPYEITRWVSPQRIFHRILYEHGVYRVDIDVSPKMSHMDWSTLPKERWPFELKVFIVQHKMGLTE